MPTTAPAPHKVNRADYDAHETQINDNTSAISTQAGQIGGLQAQVDAVRTTVPTNVQTGTSYTLMLTDAGKDVRMSNAAASTLTVPPNSSVAFPTDSVIGMIQYGTGQVTVTPGAGVTLRAPDGLKSAKLYASVTLKKLGTDEWLVSGNTVV